MKINSEQWRPPAHPFCIMSLCFTPPSTPSISSGHSLHFMLKHALQLKKSSTMKRKTTRQTLKYHFQPTGATSSKQKNKISNSSHVGHNVQKLLESGHRRTLITEGDGSSRISSLCNCTPEELENFVSSSSSDSSDSEEDPYLTHKLSRRCPPRVKRWKLGLGYSKILPCKDVDNLEEVGADEERIESENGIFNINK